MELIDPQEGLDKLNTLLYKVNQSVKQNQFYNLNRKKFTYDCTQPKLLVGGQLKQYQIQALKWMIDLARRNLNAILADDMGLGKTIQSIAYLAYLKEQHGITGKYLIIAPKTVTTNWLYQMNKWLPCCNAIILFATEKQREFTAKNIIRPRKFDAIITTYQGVTNSIDLLRKISWQIIIVDEAHKIKNDESILAMNLRRYKAQFKLLLTGTPLSNNLRQLWSLLNYIMPQIFENRQLFDQIENTVNFFRGSEEEKFKHQCAIANKFHRIIDPFILRRTKKQINLGLEKKTQNTLFVSLTKLQLKMYKNLLKFSSVYGPYNEHAMNKTMSMRKICNHPYMYPDIEDQQTNGQHLVENCGKLIVLDKLLNKLINEDHKILLFSQFTTFLNIFEDYCEMRGYQYCRIDGQKTIQERQRQIKRFNTKKKIPLFLLSTRAGGLGINLTAADVVIIYDIDWNPQNDNQAMDRAYRIGQTKPVHVFKLITQNTIEQRMLEVQKYKLIWDELVIQKGGMIRKKKGGDFLSSLDYDSISKIGMGDIFRLQLSRENQTIDEIIKMGEEKDQKKYEQAKKKIMDQLQNSILSEKFANPFEGINEEKQCKQFLQFKSDYQQGKKLTRIEQKNLRQQKNRTESQKFKNKIKKLKIKSSFQLPFYHLYVDEEQLRQMMYDLKLKQSENESPEMIKILEQKIQALNSKAFTNWTKQQFHKFIQSAKIHQIHNFQAISKQIGTKTIHQVEQYMNAFFQREMKDSKVKKIVAELNSAQIKLKKKIKHIQIMEYFKKDNLIPLRLNSSRNRSRIIANFYSLRVIINNQLISEESLSRYMEKDLIAIELSKLFGQSFYENQLIKIRKNTVAQFRQKTALKAKMILKKKLNKLKKIYLKQHKKNKPRLKVIQAKLDNDQTPSNISDVTLINMKVHAQQKVKKTRKKPEKTKPIKNGGNEIKVSELKQKEEQKCQLKIKQQEQNDK